MNDQLSDWLLCDETFTVEFHGESLTDSRYWKCDLGEGDIALIPCGGPHANHMDEFEFIQVLLIERDT